MSWKSRNREGNFREEMFLPIRRFCQLSFRVPILNLRLGHTVYISMSYDKINHEREQLETHETNTIVGPPTSPLGSTP